MEGRAQIPGASPGPRTERGGGTIHKIRFRVGPARVGPGRQLLSWAVVASLLVAFPATLAAQGPAFGVEGRAGLGIPVGELAEFLDAGPAFGVKFLYGVSERVSLTADGSVAALVGNAGGPRNDEGVRGDLARCRDRGPPDAAVSVGRVGVRCPTVRRLPARSSHPVCIVTGWLLTLPGAVDAQMSCPDETDSAHGDRSGSGAHASALRPNTGPPGRPASQERVVIAPWYGRRQRIVPTSPPVPVRACWSRTPASCRPMPPARSKRAS